MVYHAFYFGLQILIHRLSRQQISRGILLGKGLRGLFESLGATFIKLGQILSARPDLLSHEITTPLSQLQDHVAPVEVGQIRGLLEAAFGCPIDNIFEQFEFKPIASGSVAQVHRAQLPNGRHVAVKIRRPGLVRQVDTDLRLARFFARFLALIPAFRTMPLVDLISEFERPIRQQLDFKQEAANIRRFRANFALVERITMPVLVEELCTESVLTMDYLEHLEKVTSTRFSDEERKAGALAGLRALYKMIFTDGFIHADMHPGNVFLRQWGDVVILDMGLVAELSNADLNDFVDFFFGLVSNQGQVCARILYDTAPYCAPYCDRQAFEAAIVELVATHSSLSSQEFEVTHFVYQLIETQRRFGIRGSTHFIMSVLAMVVFDGICKQLYPECDFQREARGFLLMAKYRRNGAAAAM